MAVIVEISLPSQEFELGRILQMEGDTNIRLETMVPLGERSVPFFRVAGMRDAFEKTVRDHPAVDDLAVITAHEDETLYALDWDPSTDTFFRAIDELNAHLLEATGGAEAWLFELRFPSHDALSEFQQACFDADIPLDVLRIYNPTRPDAGPWFGLTVAQRETLARAVEDGYYAIPRGTTTNDLAREFDISDQAITERLRRAIDTLTRNTLLLTQSADSSH
jgi:predicted DNA binding protein